MRNLLLAIAALTMLATAPVSAAPCKDAKGNFTESPPAAAPKATWCKVPAIIAALFGCVVTRIIVGQSDKVSRAGSSGCQSTR